MRFLAAVSAAAVILSACAVPVRELPYNRKMGLAPEVRPQPIYWKVACEQRGLVGRCQLSRIVRFRQNCSCERP